VCSDLTIKPRPSPPLCWQIHRCLAVSVPTLRLWVHCPRASDGLLPPRLHLVGYVRWDARSNHSSLLDNHVQQLSDRTSSSRTPLLRPGPLRTGRDSFPSSGSSTSNASWKETRFWGQQALQGSHLAPPACLRRLRDTHLESANVALDGAPLDGVPFLRFI
jgi:hypothetical protein